MKKSFKGVICGIVIACFIGLNIYTLQNETKLSDLTLANIEALANNRESGYSCSASANCYYGGRQEGSVSCTGTSNCSSGHQYVICDGNISYCV
ncbi:NVEALA domain-containing protein [Bacteroides reticulotermitis]|uniref:NVEALA protein n=1 Tax=Bacteroides reticulotermitis TaxID=1133319 RepID=A0A840D463_9BACE|nr:NVEALA domain-containing protein [Bacteroides reticulotermitis]MBB4043242.1 hypothetical protein [Bacteroides reticulotermitis]